jgi:predicted PurR-regulated permease PerM
LGRQAAFWIAALAAVLLFLWIFSGILLPFIMGMALAYLLDPIADRLQSAGMNRFWATITIILLAILVYTRRPDGSAAACFAACRIS